MELRKRMVKVSKQETLLLLRAYREHPTRWAEILEEIMQNLQHLPDDARNLYRSSSRKQLRDRLSSKFGKLLTTKQDAIDDVEIQYVSRERSGSVVECFTRDRRAAGSSLTDVTALWSLSKTHLS